MTTILPLNDWFEITSKHGTSGDQVMDILYSWKAQLEDWEEGLKADAWKESFILDVNRIAELETENAKLNKRIVQLECHILELRAELKEDDRDFKEI